MKNKYTSFNSIPYESHMLVYEKIHPSSRVLDIGCATGYFAKKLKEKKCYVCGLEIDKNSAELAKKVCDKVVLGDIEKMSYFPFDKKSFDYILLLDVLEHLINPEKILGMMRSYLKPNGRVILSIPNIAHISVRLKMLKGEFDYIDKGIMDKTHLRFFTKASLLKMIDNLNYKVVHIDYSSDFGQLPYFGRIGKKIPKQYQYIVTKTFNTLFAIQFICTLKN